MKTPISFQKYFPANSRRHSLALLFILFPVFVFSQTLTGLWSGISSNDSNTIRKNQSFEIALTESNGSVWGYSLSEFIVNDSLYYIVKKVKGVITGDSCEVTDEEIITNNFQGKLDKGVKVTSIFRRNHYDSSWHLDGKWKTNTTKKYYAISGKVGLQTNEDLASSKLFAHLEEMKLADDVAFYKERKNDPVFVKIAKPEKVRSEYSDQPIASNQKIILSVNARPAAGTKETNTLVDNGSDTLYVLPERDKPITALSDDKDKKISQQSGSIIPDAVNKQGVQTDYKTVYVDTVFGIHSKNKSLTSVSEPNKNIAGTDVKVSPQSVNKKITVPDKSLATNSPDKQNNSTNNQVVPASTNTKTSAQPTAINKTTTDLNKSLAQTTTNKNSVSTTQQTTNKPIQNTNPVQQPSKQQTLASNPLPQEQHSLAVVNKPVIVNTNTTALNNSSKTDVSQSSISKQNPEEIIQRSAVIEGRKSEFRQIVNYQSDSLVLALYDNGEIDGDTVSVFLNGQVIIDKQMLKATAIKRTIYITPGMDEFRIVMYAENLGLYPPNTGLLVVHDGEDVYNLQFSSDFDKSAGIIFRKKVKE